MKILTVVNDMLATLGERPLNSMSDNHAYKAAAIRALETNNKRIQSQGWYFNRDEVKLPRDTSNRIPLPNDCLTYSSYTPGYVKRGEYLYDAFTSSYEFSADDYGTIVRDIPFESLDEIAAAYMAATAIAEFQLSYDGDSDKQRKLLAMVTQFRVDLKAEDIRQVRPNLFENSSNVMRLKRIFPRRR